VVLGASIALYNPPLRVAEEFAMLDCISGGRLVALIASAGLWMDEHPIPDIFSMRPYELHGYLFYDAEAGAFEKPAEVLRAIAQLQWFLERRVRPRNGAPHMRHRAIVKTQAFFRLLEISPNDVEKLIELRVDIRIEGV
jgi:hypothetical protein